MWEKRKRKAVFTEKKNANSRSQRKEYDMTLQRCCM